MYQKSGKANKKLTLAAEIFHRAVEQIITPEDLRKKLEKGTQLRIKFGVDVTASALHIGNAVNLWKMRELQEYGHKVVFLIGDFTTIVGDPTGRLERRSKEGIKNIESWAKNFISQIGAILLTDKKVFEVRRNSEWYGKMRARELVDLMQEFTHARLIERDMFQNRIKQKKEIAMPELIYPILQGYDSVMLKSDLTIIGSDQLFNENIGRFLQERFHQPPQVLMTTTITPGIDGGPKMSKSLGNYIGLDDTPTDKFGKAMRILDSLIIPYLEVYTDVSKEEISTWKKTIAEGENPMKAKLFFAEALVRRYHGEKIAHTERENFIGIYSKKDMSSVLAAFIEPGEYDIIDILQKLDLVSSRSEARRLIEQRAVEINGEVLDTIGNVSISHGDIIKVGKKRFVKIS